MKTALTILMACAITAAAWPRNELEQATMISRRFVFGTEVDISPLIKWREMRRGERPLKAWHYMTGRILLVQPGQWVMEVKIEGEDDAQKIILRHPPQAALAEFTQLQETYSALVTEAQAA